MWGVQGGLASVKTGTRAWVTWWIREGRAADELSTALGACAAILSRGEKGDADNR